MLYVMYILARVKLSGLSVMYHSHEAFINCYLLVLNESEQDTLTNQKTGYWSCRQIKRATL